MPDTVTIADLAAMCDWVKVTDNGRAYNGARYANRASCAAWRVVRTVNEPAVFRGYPDAADAEAVMDGDAPPSGIDGRAVSLGDAR